MRREGGRERERERKRKKEREIDSWPKGICELM